jgi:hypothetical protein
MSRVLDGLYGKPLNKYLEDGGLSIDATFDCSVEDVSIGCAITDDGYQIIVSYKRPNDVHRVTHIEFFDDPDRTEANSAMFKKGAELCVGIVTRPHLFMLEDDWEEG